MIPHVTFNEVDERKSEPGAGERDDPQTGAGIIKEAMTAGRSSGAAAMALFVHSGAVQPQQSCFFYI